MNKRYCVPEIPESEQTPTVKMLLLLLEQFAQRIHEQDEEIARLKDAINLACKTKRKRKVRAIRSDQGLRKRPRHRH
jgi:hypothetical protein